MTKSKEKCQCAIAAFSFADDTKRLSYFLKMAHEAKTDDSGKSSRSFSTHVLKQLREDVVDIKENCGTDIGDSLRFIDGSLEILNQRQGRLDFKEYSQIDSLLGRLDGEVLTDLKACARRKG